MKTKDCENCEGMGKLIYKPLGGRARLVTCATCNGTGKEEIEE